MLFPNLFRSTPTPDSRRLPFRRTVTLQLEALEERCVLSADLNPAVIPTPPAMPMAQLRETMNQVLPKGDPRVVFMGDSITDWFETGPGAPVWFSTMFQMPALDLAVLGNGTQQVLWQIANGDLSGISPQVVVLMVGVNNLMGGATPEQTAEGIAADVIAIRLAQPQAQILLLGVLPSGQTPDNPLRGAIAQTNALISRFDNGINIHYADVGAPFLQANGSLSPGLIVDGVHPSTEGYFFLAADEFIALVPVLLEAEALDPWNPSQPAPAPPANSGGSSFVQYYTAAPTPAPTGMAAANFNTVFTPMLSGGPFSH